MRGDLESDLLGTGAALTMVCFELSRSAQCGLQLAEGGVADLSNGEVAKNLIGASVTTAGFDIGRISAQVNYRDNTQMLDALFLPLPARGMPKL